MNRHVQYRPLLDRTLERYQIQHLARRYDFGPESRIAEMLVRHINTRMAEAESDLGVERLPPWTLALRTQRGRIGLPLFRPDYLEPLLAGEDFRAARRRVRTACLEALRQHRPRATETDLLALIDPWALARRRGPSRYVDHLEMKVDPARRSADWQSWIDTIRPRCPLDRLDTLDVSAPEDVLAELSAFVSAETHRGPLVARQLVEETITLRNACCPRTSQLDPGEILVLATHVRAHPGTELAARFRRQTPVILTLWTAEELARPRPLRVPEQLEELKRRLVRVCFEAYRQDGLLSLLDLQWLFQISSARVSELLRSVHREHNIVVPTPGTILDAGRSMTHKDVIVGLHLAGYSVREIARKTYHSPRAVDHYIGTFEAVLILKHYGVPPPLMARLLRRGRTLVQEHLDLVDKLQVDEARLFASTQQKGVEA